MNDSERTPSKEAKLKLKGFHKRQIIIKAVKNLFVKRKVDKPDKPHDYGGSGGNGYKCGCFTYTIESIKKVTYVYFAGYKHTYIKEKARFSQTFNKQQLPGKLILINGKYFRIKK